MSKGKVLFAIFIVLVACGKDFIPRVKSPIPSLSREQLPGSFWWGNVSGINYLTVNKNQHIPQFCESGWAMAVTSCLSDRIKIMRKAAWPDHFLSPQVLLSCDMDNQGCSGGQPALGYQWIHQNNITAETCSPYVADGHDMTLGCSSQIKCTNCTEEGCETQKRAMIYGVDEYGQFSREEGDIELAMMNEIYQRGPISCQLALTMEFYNYTGGIFEDETGKKGYEHDISITGWGEQNGVKYWNLRNSWGTYWGEDGDMRIVRGKDNLGVETRCSWGVPRDTWTNDERNQTDDATQETIVKQAGTTKIPNIVESLNRQELMKEMSVSTRPYQPHDFIDEEDLPDSWDWRNVHGINYVTSWAQNIHSPSFCDASWAMALTSALGDRIKIARNASYPEIILSPQVLINCGIGGTCAGGDLETALEKLYENNFGIPEETCQNYEGKDPDSHDCSDIQVCKNCQNVPSEKVGSPDCFGRQEFPYWIETSYGRIIEVHKIQIQLWFNGSVACILFPKLLPKPDKKFVSLVGWGRDGGGKGYWMLKNYYGCNWGDRGYFKKEWDDDPKNPDLVCYKADAKKQIKDLRKQHLFDQ